MIRSLAYYDRSIARGQSLSYLKRSDLPVCEMDRSLPTFSTSTLSGNGGEMKENLRVIVNNLVPRAHVPLHLNSLLPSRWSTLSDFLLVCMISTKKSSGFHPGQNLHFTLLVLRARIV